MKKQCILVGISLLLAGCVQPSEQQFSQQQAKLRQAYSACINTAEGSTDKLAACQAVLEVLKQEKAHQQFAQQETVRVLDYQRCLTARQTGDGQAYAEDCGKIWQEIKANNTQKTTN